MAVARNGDLFFSHSSSDYDIDKVVSISFPNPSGRLIHYERASGKMKVLLDGLWFGNGVVLSPDESFVVVADSNWSRLMKIWLKGSNVGSSEIFIDGLPGTPDNLTPDNDGIWVPLPVSADDEHPLLSHKLSKYPMIRKFLARFMELIKMPFAIAHKIYPNPITGNIVLKIGSMEMFSFLFPARHTIVRLDWNGNVVASYHSFDKSFTATTHVLEIDGFLYLGSILSDYIGRVKIDTSKIHSAMR